jgi:hypothetical protein
VVIDDDPVVDGACRVLDAVEALAMGALFLLRTDDALDHAVLLGAMRRDELLLQSVASNQRSIAPTGEDQAVVGSQQELPRPLAEHAEPVDEGMLESAGSGSGLAGSRQLPAQKLTGVAVNDQSRRGPAVAASSDPAEIRRPAFVRRGCERGHRLDPWTHADRALANLPALDLEDLLHRVLVEAQKPDHRAVAEGRLLLDHGLDRLGKARIDLRCSLCRLVVDYPLRHAKPYTKFGQRHRDPIR